MVETDPTRPEGELDLPWEPLAPRARWLFHGQAMVNWLVFWAPASAVLAVVGVWFLPWMYAVIGALSFCFLQFIWALWVPSLSFERWGYLVDEEQLRITSGWLFRRVTSIPLGRIQHVDTRQGPIERWFDLSQLYIHTASGVGSDGMIPGLEPAAAEMLRKKLLSRVDEDAGV